MEWTITVPGFKGKSTAKGWGEAFGSPVTQFVKNPAGGVRFTLTLQQLPPFVERERQSFRLDPVPDPATTTEAFYTKVIKGSGQSDRVQPQVVEEEEPSEEEEEEGASEGEQRQEAYEDDDPMEEDLPPSTSAQAAAVPIQDPMRRLSLLQPAEGNPVKSEAERLKEENERLRRLLAEAEAGSKQKDKIIEQERKEKEQAVAETKEKDQIIEQKDKIIEQKDKVVEQVTQEKDKVAENAKLALTALEVLVRSLQATGTGTHLDSQIVLPPITSVAMDRLGEIIQEAQEEPTELKQDWSPSLLADAFAKRDSTVESDHQKQWTRLLDKLCKKSKFYEHFDCSARPLLGSTQKPDSVVVLRNQERPTFGNLVFLAELKPRFEHDLKAGYNEIITRFRSILTAQHGRHLCFFVYGNLRTICLFLLDTNAGNYRSPPLELIQPGGPKGLRPGPGLNLLWTLLQLPPAALGFLLLGQVEAKMRELRGPSILLCRTPSSTILQQGEQCFKFSPRAPHEHEILAELGRHRSIVEYTRASDPRAGYLVLKFYSPIPDFDPASSTPQDAAPFFQYARGIHAALVYAHGKDIFHRDLSPANIMLAGTTPVLLDWGCATRAGHAGVDEVVGTFFYLSLGQLKILINKELARDAAQDLLSPAQGWSLGRGSPTARADFEPLFSTLVYWLSGKAARWRKKVGLELLPSRVLELKEVFQAKATYFLKQGGDLDQLAGGPGMQDLKTLRDRLYPRNRHHRDPVTFETFVDEADLTNLW